MDFHEMAAVGFTSFTAGAPGVRAMRYRKSVCAPAMPDLARSTRDGRSSEWVKGMLSPMPPVPAVPTFTKTSVPDRFIPSRAIWVCRMSCGR